MHNVRDALPLALSVLLLSNAAAAATPTQTFRPTPAETSPAHAPCTLWHLPTHKRPTLGREFGRAVLLTTAGGFAGQAIWSGYEARLVTAERMPWTLALSASASFPLAILPLGWFIDHRVRYHRLNRPGVVAPPWAEAQLMTGRIIAHIGAAAIGGAVAWSAAADAGFGPTTSAESRAAAYVAAGGLVLNAIGNTVILHVAPPKLRPSKRRQP